MNAYEAKFAREAKEKPSNWVIAPNGYGGCKLINTLISVGAVKPKTKLRLVK